MSAAGIRAGRAYVELGLKDKLPGELSLAERNLKARVEGIQRTIKNLRTEDRATGESALGSVLKGGMGGVTDTVASYFGAGVAVMGISFVARGLKDAAIEAGKLKQELDAGGISAGEMADRLMGSIPVFGEVWQAGRAIRELFTGEKAAIEEINRQTERMNSLIDIQIRQRKTLKELARSTAEELERGERTRAKIGAGGDEFAKARIDLDQETADQRRARDAKKEQVTADFLKDDPKLQELKKARDAMANKVAELQAIAQNSGPGTAGLQYAAKVELADLEPQYQILDATYRQAAAARAAGLKQIEQDYQKLLDSDEKTRDAKMGGVVGAYEAENERVREREAAAQQRDQELADQRERESNRQRQQGDELNAEQANRDMATSHEVAMIQNEGIVDPYARRKAQLKEQYDYEVKLAQDSAEKKKAAEERYRAAVANLEAEHAREQERANRDIDYEIAAQEIQTRTRGGMRGRLAMIELNRQRALEQDADPANAVHVGAERINRLYDLQREEAMNQGIISRGTFSAQAAALSAVGGGGTMEESMRKTAENTSKIVEGVDDVRDAVENGGMVVV